LKQVVELLGVDPASGQHQVADEPAAGQRGFATSAAAAYPTLGVSTVTVPTLLAVVARNVRGRPRCRRCRAR
jgi:hypothetical protein